MKVPTLTSTNYEVFDLSFTAPVRIQNALNVIPLDFLLSPDMVRNYYSACNYREEEINVCANLLGQAFDDDVETL